MDTLRIERTVVLHGAQTRGSRTSRPVEQRAGPYLDAAARARERAGLRRLGGISFHLDETSVRFSYDKEIGRIVMQVLDTESARVVKQLPPEEMVAFLKRFHKALAVLVDKTA